MEKNGIRSERQLANLMGVSQQTINRIFSGMTPDPRISTIEAIAQFFNIDISTLLNVDLTVSSVIYKAGVPLLKWKDAHLAKKFIVKSRELDLTEKSNGFLYAVIVEDDALSWPFSSGTTLVLEGSHREINSGDYLLIHQNGHNYLKKALLNEQEVWVIDVKEQFPAKPLASDNEVLGLVKEIHF